jgi:DMSO/TMAO reductase YedYZ heme-binding membrane subunit
MSPEHQQPNSENVSAELAFVQQALAAADRSERSSRIIVGVLAILAVVVFIWMHHQMFPPETLGGLLHSLLRVDLFFLVLAFAITMYLRQVMNKNTRTILRALANTRQR